MPACRRKQENDLFEALQRKAIPEIEEMLAVQVADDGQRSRLAALARLNGGNECSRVPASSWPARVSTVMAALDNLCAIAGLLSSGPVMSS